MGLIEVAGYYSNLKRGFDELGIDSTFVECNGHPFGYKHTSSKGLLSLVQFLGQKRAAARRSQLPVKALWLTFFQLSRLPLFFWALARFDVFLFGFKSSLLPAYLDLPILKLFGKTLIFVFHGSDSRPPYINGALLTNKHDGLIKKLVRLTRKQKADIVKIERFADVIVNHPPTSHFHKQKIIQWLSIGIPYAGPVDPPPVRTRREERTVRVLHSPSKPESKGSEGIRSAIASLQRSGHKVELIEVIGKPNSVVLKELSSCDFVVDQLYSDTPMAGFATEAAYFGKPAVVGGYATEVDWGPPNPLPPSLYVRPEEIESAIERLITDNEYRLMLGQQAKAFVHKQWSAREVARRYVRLIQKDIPQHWWFEPEQLQYLHGYGLTEARIREILRTLVNAAGVNALCLSDKPSLQTSFVQFAFQTVPKEQLLPSGSSVEA
jgi:glycosyltransferase involved in cell wall biosynthesis